MPDEFYKDGKVAALAVETLGKLVPNPYRPKDAPDYALTTSGELRNYQGMPEEGPVSDALARQLKHGYYAAASYTDAQIGKVLDALDRQGLRKNTVIVLWGGSRLEARRAWRMVQAQQRRERHKRAAAVFGLGNESGRAVDQGAGRIR